MPLPVLLDTEIGTDIDDAYALVLAAESPELDLRTVTTVNHDVCLRARIAKKLLRLMNRDHAPVAPGASESLTPGIDRGWGGHEGKGIDLRDIHVCQDPWPEKAPLALAAAARAAHDRGLSLTIITIGAMTNVARALEWYPDEMALTGRIISMASSFRDLGEENAEGEHNVACDPLAMQRVLESQIPITLIGLNVTRQTSMTAAQVDDLARIGGPLAEALAGMHRVWFERIQRDHSPMHDAVAVAAAFRPDLVELIPVRARVEHPAREAGTVIFEPSSAGEPIRHQVAVSLDAEGFHALFFERIRQAVTKDAYENRATRTI